MGGTSSKEEKPFCVDCQKENQKDLPTKDEVSSDGQPCSDFYAKVAECMEAKQGQVTACRTEWDAFQKCHGQHAKRR